ncbi:MAG TPA: hypothetical protein PLN52_04055, partial [Opitutaceae bacterium]|nr:hypothetical protein [Opitutaceae bacterium]
GKTHPYFYNPMWRFFDEQPLRPNGTYFYNPRNLESIHWHVFDQVLLRPDLVTSLIPGSLKIIDRCGDHTFVDKNSIPDVSDHLPIAFKLSEL